MTPGNAADLLLEMIIDQGSGYDELGRRVMANKIIGVLSGWLPPEKKAACAEILEPMTTTEAVRFGRTTLDFGVHQGEPIADISRAYLAWLSDRSRELFRNLHRYLNNPDIKAEYDRCEWDGGEWDN